MQLKTIIVIYMYQMEGKMIKLLNNAYKTIVFFVANKQYNY